MPNDPTWAGLAAAMREVKLAILSLTSHIRAEQRLLALQRQNVLTKKFRPDQPRVPAGNPGGGQWANGLHLASRVRGPYLVGHFQGRAIFMTPNQAARLTTATVYANAALARARERDPSYRPPNQLFEPTHVESVIRAQQELTRHAEQHVRAIDRNAYGHNGGPPLSPSQSQGPTPATVTSAYREMTGMPRDTGSLNPPSSHGTIAHARIDGQDVFGVNSRSPAFTQRDDDMARDMRDRLIRELPNIMNTRNIGGIPNDALFHAEANLLFRAAEQYGGSLQGRTIDITVDRPFCQFCQTVLPEIASRLGNPTVVVRDRAGRVYELQNGTPRQR